MLELEKTEGGPEVEVVATEVKNASPDELLKKVNEIGDQLRGLILQAKKLPREKSLEAHQDPARALSIAQVNLQTGFAWLRKAIMAPKEF